MKRFEDLTIADDYMFYHVMQNENLCKTLLTAILSDKIGEISEIAVQKSFETASNAKGIRLDVWVVDNKGKQYNIEMQTINNRNLARRMRYYQSAIDSHLLEKGSHYSELADSFIIFICPFDYPNKGLPIYTFKSICLEDGKTELDDGISKIIVNSSASEKVKDKNLKAFLEYMNGQEPKNEFVESLKNQIDTFKHNNKMREDYMYRMTVEDEIRFEAAKEATQKAEAKATAEAQATLKSLRDMGVNIEKLAEATGLSVEEIKAL